MTPSNINTIAHEAKPVTIGKIVLTLDFLMKKGPYLVMVHVLTGP